MINKIDDDLSSSSDSDEEMVNISEELIKIKNYQNKIKINIEDYDSHCNLIKSLRLCNDKKGAKEARELMSEHFPLSPEMWLEWIEDEKAEIDKNGDKSIIYLLLKRAVEDYRSIDIWVEFCQFSLSYFNDKNEIRSVFEEAVSQVGAQFKGGHIIWGIWLIYERDILMDGLEEEKIVEQRDRVFKLYSRLLSLPLEGNKEVYEDFLERNKMWKYPEENIKEKYNSSCKIIECLKTFEDNLVNTEIDYVSHKTTPEEKSKEERWIEYVNFAEENFLKKENVKDRIFQNKADIINLYERGITDICLSQSLWSHYITYLSNNFETDKDRMLIACKRAIRNNTSSLELRLLLARNMERFVCTVEEIRKVFSDILRSSLSDSNPFLPLWQAYLDFERRQISSNNSDMTVIRGLFGNLIALDNYLDYDPYCSLIKYWAYIEARYGSNIEKARELWAMVRKSLGTNNTALWLENLEFERRFGDFENCKRLMNNAVNCFTDYPEYLFERVLRWLSEEGDIGTYLMFMKKIRGQQKKIDERKSKEAEAKKQGVPIRKLKRANDEKKTNISENKKAKVTENVKESLPVAKHSGIDKLKAVVYAEERCVFVSNLSFKVAEKDLEEMFSKSGELEDIRLSRLENGKSRGFAYIQYKDNASVEEALKLEHSVLMERPMFVNRCDPNKRHSFNYAVGEAENNKLFIKNLPKTTTKQALEEIYSKFGSLKDVRLVTLRNGISKGIAYVEFLDENTASKALVATDGIMIGDNTIEVLISKTPQKNLFNKEEVIPKSETFLVPRSLQKVPPSTQKKQIHQSSVSSSTSVVSSVKKSNDDFRKFLK